MYSAIISLRRRSHRGSRLSVEPLYRWECFPFWGPFSAPSFSVTVFPLRCFRCLAIVSAFFRCDHVFLSSLAKRPGGVCLLRAARLPARRGFIGVGRRSARRQPAPPSATSLGAALGRSRRVVSPRLLVRRLIGANPAGFATQTRNNRTSVE